MINFVYSGNWNPAKSLGSLTQDGRTKPTITISEALKIANKNRLRSVAMYRTFKIQIPETLHSLEEPTTQIRTLHHNYLIIPDKIKKKGEG